MPFVARKLEPRFVCRGHVPAGTANWPVGAELEAVANGTLAALLRQLASLLGAAEDVFGELTHQLAGIAERSDRLRGQISGLEERLAAQDPKKIPVPESDICTFAARRLHFRSRGRQRSPSRLFTLETRPAALRRMYEAVAAASIDLRSLDALRRDRLASDLFICSPVTSRRRRRDQSLDIEARRPRAVEQLRRWTSAEALGDVTVAPDCASRILGGEASHDDSEPVDHKLPSPEEQLQVVALRFPAELVAVDVSGRGFHRMSTRRRSLQQQQQQQQSARQADQTAAAPVRRRSRPRRARGKRRNTIAGTDHKEIRQAVDGQGAEAGEAQRSASIDLLDSEKRSPPPGKRSHFDTLKAWGRSRLRLISPKSARHSRGSSGSLAAGGGAEAPRDESLDDGPLVAARRSRRESGKAHERKPSSSSSSGKSSSSSARTQLASGEAPGERREAADALAAQQQPRDRQQPQPSRHHHQQQQQQQQQVASGGAGSNDGGGCGGSKSRDSVRLRESAAERRERRKARADEPPHSSSGNWSASSESGRASIGSETTSTTHPPRSTTTASIGTSSTSLSHVRRLKGCRDTSASSSVTSEGTLTPDIIQDISALPFSDDGETSSVYSCDTEGYYTSFHVDSGLKTLREEEPLAQPQSPLTRSNELQTEATSPLAENEYELYGRGSTSTTTSSAGTVCTTLMAPPPPERKSSLAVVATVHGGAAQKQDGGESPDSGHNTSSSPVESASSPACTGRSCSEFEYSESSDLEGCDRIERIRSKTAINTSRIPSMCVITPSNSDDEHAHVGEAVCKAERKQKPRQANGSAPAAGSVLMSATVGSSKMEVINGQDKNLYATVQTVTTSSQAYSADKSAAQNPNKTSPLSGVLERLRGVLPGWKQQHQHKTYQDDNRPQQAAQPDFGDYVTIADVRSSSRRRQDNAINGTPVKPNAPVTYANADLFRRDAEYVSLSELPKKADSSLERRRQGARVTLDSDGKVVYSSDSLKRRKGAHTTFIPGPFVKEASSSPAQSPLLRRANITPRAVTRTGAVDTVDGESGTPFESATTPSPASQQPGKVIIRAAKSPERAASPDYVRIPMRVVGPTTTAAAAATAATSIAPSRQTLRHGAYVNVQGGEGSGEDQALLALQPNEQVSTAACPPQSQPQPPPYVGPPRVRKPHEQCPTSSAQRRQPDERPTQFHTLPSRRPERDGAHEPPRSVTPDITRGLARGPLSSAHMLAAQQRARAPRPDLRARPLERFELECELAAQQRRRLAPPVGASALGYRLLASAGQDAGVPPSPIGPERSNGFGASTPLVADRPAAPPGQPHGLLSPIKSSMSNEELFAAIHKSKRRLNIRDEPGRLSPRAHHQRLVGTRHSWSPESHKLPEIPRTSTAPLSATSRMDFKRLLLQQSIKSGPVRLSAAEQLKLSRQQCQEQQAAAAAAPPQTPTKSASQQQQLAKVLSPRSAWRFQTPRTDVLSSTIVEDAAAEEKAMKPSPEAELGARRQLDLGSGDFERLKNRINDLKSQQRSLEKREKELENRLQLIDARAEVDPVKAIEHRRISNQLARAQFLASSGPTGPRPGADPFGKRFRARSESPRQSDAQRTKPADLGYGAEEVAVARCPSAPALETAL